MLRRLFVNIASARLCIVLLVVGVLCILSAFGAQAQPPANRPGNSRANALVYPPTKLGEVVEKQHGISVADPYRWLENDRAPEVEAWVAAQAATAQQYLDAIPFRRAVRTRLEELNNYEKVWSPRNVKGTTYFMRQTGEEKHAILYRQRSKEERQVLLDPETWSNDGTVRLSDWDVEENGRWLAFSRSSGGSDWQQVMIMDLATRQVLRDTLNWVKVSGTSWWQDGIFYGRYAAPEGGKSELSSVNKGHMVYYHKIGTSQTVDKLVYEEPSEPEQFNFCWVPEGSNLLFRAASKGADRGSRIWFRPADDAAAPWKEVFQSNTASFDIINVRNDTLYALTNLNAPNGRIVRMPHLLHSSSFETILPESKYVIQGVSILGDYIHVTKSVDVKDEVDVYRITRDPRNTLEHVRSIPMPGPGSVGGFGGRRTDTLVYYTFTSYTYPTTIFTYHVATGESKVWRTVKAQFRPEDFVAKQVFVASKDGTRVPMFVMHRKGLKYDGTAPTILYGYGGFNVSESPSFNPLRIAWLEQGGVFVVANLRGGGEYGETWHEAGTKTKKQNVFDDYIACAEWLIKRNVTSASRLAMNGRSNGGLLVGAVMTQRPDLFRVAVPEVGVMDMLRYHMFTIGWNWAADYGTAAEESEFKALLAYSPVHNVRANVEYPSTMVMTADHDDRVVPAHSFKFAAALQHAYTGARPMLMRVETRSGHGAVNTAVMLDGVADKFSFMWNEMGVSPVLVK
ncbi:MAG: prolyl oligopeptidase family serine peptidase [bacterium]|nr:prolyl oligopeptidase family serine peptidase [bacterium]